VDGEDTQGPLILLIPEQTALTTVLYGKQMRDRTLEGLVEDPSLAPSRTFSLVEEEGLGTKMTVPQEVVAVAVGWCSLSLEK